ncbi:MAG: M14 family zinc carboxypeptidase [Pseudomonadota bacterium]
MKAVLLAAATAALALQNLLPLSAEAQPTPDPETRRLQDAERQRNNIYRAWSPDPATGRLAAISFHGSLLESNNEAGWLVLELDAAGVAKLQAFGFRLERADDFIARRDRVLDTLQATTAAKRKVDARAADATIQSIPNFSCYETVEETYTAAAGMAVSKPNLATWIDIGDSWERGALGAGYDLGVLKLTNSATLGNKPKLFVQAAIHAREYTTAPLTLAFARWLVDGYGINADATWILDHHEVHLLLQANPDGRKKAETGLLWRKNTNTAYCSANSDLRGVDLNRNFGYTWNSTNGVGSSGFQCDVTYRGPSAASEPETQAIEAYVRSLWADRRGNGLTDPAPGDTSGIHIDLHSFSELVLWPWGTTQTPTGNGAALTTLGRKLAFFNGYTPQQSIGLYPTDGTADSVSYGELGVAALTIEMGTSFFQSCSDYSSKIAPTNLSALIYAAKVARTPYLTPSGPDVLALALGGGASSNSGVPAGTLVNITATATDERFAKGSKEPTQPIAAAEAYIDIPPWVSGAVPISLVAADGSFGGDAESLSGTIATGGLAAGRHVVFVRAQDAGGTWGPTSAVFLNIGPIAAPSLSLTLAEGGKNKRLYVDLAWSGSGGDVVDVYRSGTLVLTTANDGAERIATGSGTWTFQVCPSGATTGCSATLSVTQSP